ncbi:MAG TPA: hypothetical protein VH062_04595 [Polyangiaceae bacterium]|jgi:hypothetical protein|nr:hypothetical protein [Polyangiaceae bacterium]
MPWRRVHTNLDPALPPDCTNCRPADGGGILNLVFFSAKKYPNVKLGVISANEDDVMRFFYGFGEMNCTAAGNYPAGKFTQAITDLRTQAMPYRTQFSSYYVNGIKHMYSQFDDFYQPLSGGTTIASWETDLLAGKTSAIGP